MNKYINLLFISTIALSADISIHITPDTLYVGSLATISITIENLIDDEIVIFKELNEITEHYSLIDKILTKNSAKYKLQFWRAGDVIIHPIDIIVKGSDQNVQKMQTEELKLEIISNISNSKSSLRNIKSMKIIKLNSNLKNIIYAICLLSGFIVLFIIIKNRRNNQIIKYISEDFYRDNMNIAIDSIKNLPLPDNSNLQSNEYFYLKLSNICRQFIKEQFYVKATEMTTLELSNYFKNIGIENKIIEAWIEISSKTDMAKYARYVPSMEEYQKDKLHFCNLIKSFQNTSHKSLH